MNLESNQKKGRRERGKSADVAAIAIFLSFLLVFPLLSFVRGDRAFSENENRALAQKPEMTVQRVLNGSFEQDFEAYVQDQIMGRDTMMAWKTAGDRLIGRKDNGNVYFGKKDMLFPIEEIDWKQLSRNIDAASALQQHFIRKAMIIRYSDIFVFDFPLCVQFQQLVISQIEDLRCFRKCITQVLNCSCFPASNTGINKNVFS